VELETEIYNPNNNAMSFNAFWYWPTGSYSTIVSLNPGSSLYTDLVFAEVPETGTWQWTCWSNLPKRSEWTLGCGGLRDSRDLHFIFRP